jgi:protein-disulfide isomerase-like protein with CxxC motif
MNRMVGSFTEGVVTGRFTAYGLGAKLRKSRTTTAVTLTVGTLRPGFPDTRRPFAALVVAHASRVTQLTGTEYADRQPRVAGVEHHQVDVHAARLVAV